MTRHSGRIDVESEVGRGTTFTLSLPVTSVPEEVAPPRERAPVGRLEVLVIDDEEVVREVLVETLLEQGHEVVEVGSGRDGIAALDVRSFDVVFTDLSMPEMDGWAVARHLRRNRPDVKVVLVTGYGASVDAPGEEPDLVDAVVGKPFEFEDIAALLQRLYR